MLQQHHDELLEVCKAPHLGTAVHTEMPQLGAGVQVSQLRQSCEMGCKQGVCSQPDQLL